MIWQQDDRVDAERSIAFAVPDDLPEQDMSVRVGQKPSSPIRDQREEKRAAGYMSSFVIRHVR